MHETITIAGGVDEEGSGPLGHCLLVLYEIALFLIAAHVTQLVLNTASAINARLMPRPALDAACSIGESQPNVFHISEWRCTREEKALKRDGLK